MEYSSGEKIDFLYLDSYDIEREISSITDASCKRDVRRFSKFEEDTIVVVDDHDAFFTDNKIGKGNYVAEFMKDITQNSYLKTIKLVENLSPVVLYTF